MDLSALESAIKALENSLDSLGVWLSLCTALVVLGLIVEYAEDVKNLIAERPFNWKLFRTLIGGLLITGGVAGELDIQFKASKIETDLRTATHKVEALLNKEAGDARKAAGKAIERAAKAEAQLASANARAAKANEHASEAKARAAQARYMAEQERLARVQLEASIVARDLTPAQQQTIGNSLRMFSGRSVTLGTFLIDAEGERLGEMIRAALEFGRLTVVDEIGRIMPVGRANVGIQVDGPQTEQDLVRAIHGSLTRANLAMAPMHPPTAPGSPVRIIVGVRPFPIIRR